MSASTDSSFVAWRPNAAPRHVTIPVSRPLRDSTAGLLNLYSRCNPHFLFIRSVPRRCLTKPTQPVHNDGFDNSQHDYILHVNDTLSDGRGNDFVVLDLLGTGTFGQVVKCRHLTAGEIVAVKVIKNQPAYFNQAWVEINILRMIHLNNSSEDTRYIVKFLHHFVFRGHLCLVFERLSINLYELLKQNNYVGVNFETLRLFLSQLLRTLDVLRQSEVIHCDLKPENILLENLDTAQVKIIDFGSACQLHYPVYSYVQSRFYRAPEVLLGCPEYDSKIDMWSLGCIAGELFLGIPLFPGQNEMNMVARIVEMLGELPDRFLHRCRHTNKFFNSSRGSDYHRADVHAFQLKSVSQYEQENNVTLPEWKRFFKEKTLRDIIMTYPFRTSEPHTEEIAARECFNDLLNGMLRIDPRDRWTPADALQHPFMKGEPLPGGQPWVPPSRPYRATSRTKPILIQQPAGQRTTPIDEFYSASAPNFTPQGRLNMNTTWGTGAGGQPTTTGRGQMFQFHPPHHPMHGSVTHMHGEADSPGPCQSFAPGSYAPPPTMMMFGSSVGYTGPRRGSLGNAPANGPNVGAANPDMRPFLWPTGSDTQQRSAGSVWETPGGGARNSTSPLPHGAPFRVGNGIRMSGSRESLTGSLRMSGSRESLGMGRVSSFGDMGDDSVFSSEPEEKSFSPVQGMPFAPASLAQQQRNSPQPGPMGTRSGVASAALPPPGPRSSFGRHAPAAFGNPSALSSYGYAYSGQQQQVRSFNPLNPSIGNLQRPSGDVTMGDVDPELQRGNSPGCVPNGFLPDSMEGSFMKQREGSVQEQFSERGGVRKRT